MQHCSKQPIFVLKTNDKRTKIIRVHRINDQPSPAASLGFTGIHIEFRLTVQLPDLHPNSFTSLPHCNVNALALFHLSLMQAVISRSND